MSLLIIVPSAILDAFFYYWIILSLIRMLFYSVHILKYSIIYIFLNILADYMRRLGGDPILCWCRHYPAAYPAPSDLEARDVQGVLHCHWCRRRPLYIDGPLPGTVLSLLLLVSRSTGITCCSRTFMHSRRACRGRTSGSLTVSGSSSTMASWSPLPSSGAPALIIPGTFLLFCKMLSLSAIMWDLTLSRASDTATRSFSRAMRALRPLRTTTTLKCSWRP